MLNVGGKEGFGCCQAIFYHLSCSRAVRRLRCCSGSRFKRACNMPLLTERTKVGCWRNRSDSCGIVTAGTWLAGRQSGRSAQWGSGEQIASSRSNHVSHWFRSSLRLCRLTHKFAKTGRYASEEENGEDMCQIQAPISFREFKKIVWERAIRNSAS